MKCQLTDEDVEICAECLKTGTPCTLQAPEREPAGSEASGNIKKQEYEARLERIEYLLQNLVEAQGRQPSRITEPPDNVGSTVTPFFHNNFVSFIQSP